MLLQRVPWKHEVAAAPPAPVLQRYASATGCHQISPAPHQPQGLEGEQIWLATGDQT
jgi:hypothetical protein